MAAVTAPTEAAVGLTVNGERWLTFLCTPADLEALAVGFLFTEGLIADAADVATVQLCGSGANVEVWLRRAITRPRAWQRPAGCAGGGTGDDPELRLAAPCLRTGPCLPAAAIGELMEALDSAQALHAATGGLHCSALSDGERIVTLAEDIGRHNTLDKLAGRCLLDREVMAGSILLTTGRVSSEMALKAVRMEVPILISRSGPTSLAVERATRWGLTLIGYARHDHFTIYSHPWRLAGQPGQEAVEALARVERRAAS
ncbi:MAG: formate dehydrogenase accessory sulfurtransferase FdhD [Anaerolineales bacterium]